MFSLLEAKNKVFKYLSLNQETSPISIDLIWEYPFGWLFTFKSAIDTSKMSQIEEHLTICEVPDSVLFDKFDGYTKYISLMSPAPHYGNISLHVRDYSMYKGYEWKKEWEIDFEEIFTGFGTQHHIFA
jgi:hypothetical protein